MRHSPKMRAAMQASRMADLRPLGYTSDVFAAKYRGGKCGLSGLTIAIGEPVAFFEGRGLCLAIKISDEIHKRQLAAAPKCSCGKRMEYDDACLRCGFVCETWFCAEPRDVNRNTPLAT